MILVIDNYDSFTYNLVQYLEELSDEYPIAKEVRVERNDALSIAEIKDINPSYIVLSPGPGDPSQSGICMDILFELSGDIPILGVCLGHQAIAKAFGGKIVRARELMHGKTSHVLHNCEGLFQNLPNPLLATRYHSLIADKETLPKCLEVTAWLDDGTIMGIRHSKYNNLQGVQFHPESVLTEGGHTLLSNFLDSAKA
ncbi:aminodeoxychorismate/anthranilate synthase component II [Prochlorococcus sp. MIT 1223]|uniref:anthranilate synthase component II n=1 Tax=Prochlorococcus sp. MIT 1223 TaxID=3096217 RepID=UPI002A761C57|nr:aminodeoxychorismate/anthranilate synthase component II [Prochlorococcus sp. MIT 1223]